MSGAVEGVEVREAIIAAITRADAAFGYSYRMTGLVDGVETHTLFMDGFEPASFEDRSDGYPLIEQRRNAARTDAILAAIATPPSQSYADAIEDAAKVADHYADEAETHADLTSLGKKVGERWLTRGRACRDLALRIRLLSQLANAPAHLTEQEGQN